MSSRTLDYSLRKKGSNIFEEKYFINRRNSIFPITPYQKTFKKYRVWCAISKIKAHQFALKSSHSSQNPVQIQISFKILKEVVISIATNSLRILKEIWIWVWFWHLWELFRANWWALKCELSGLQFPIFFVQKKIGQIAKVSRPFEDSKPRCFLVKFVWKVQKSHSLGLKSNISCWILQF